MRPLDQQISQARSLIHRLERNRSHAAARLDSELAREEQAAIMVVARLDSALQDVGEKARAEIDRVGVPAHRLIESTSRLVIELRGTLTRRAAQTQRAPAQFIEVADSRCEASTMTFTFPLVTWI